METVKRATRLEELAPNLVLTPLGPEDPRYVNLSQGRGSNDLSRMEVCLQDFSAGSERYAHIAFTGHRGSGKSTELYRLEQRLKQQFFPVHLTLDATLIQDCDYTFLMLWLVDVVARDLHAKDIPLDPDLMKRVADWFAEKTVSGSRSTEREIQLEVASETEGKTSLLIASFRLMARLRSRILGSIEEREEARRRLQRYADELIDRVNEFLTHAATQLKDHGYPLDILVVQDNLDRLEPETAKTLFFTNGDFLRRLKVHTIYTVPVAMLLTPWNIGSAFPAHFGLPVVKVRTQKGGRTKAGMAALREFLAARMEIESIFSNQRTVNRLLEMSGGSVRDLLRLINQAQLAARVDGKTMIDFTSAQEAIKKLRLDFEKILIPSGIYYPLLAKIHQTKRDRGLDENSGSEAIAQTRQFFAELCFNGSVLEYNGDESWFDVHPIVQEIRHFQEILKKHGQGKATG